MLELLGIEKAFGSVVAVRDVHLSIPDGEFFSLLGPSGCGKTTLLRMLGGFEAPTRGEIRHGGVRIDTLPANQRQFNMVFQRYALFPHLSVWENVAFGLKMKRIALPEIRSRVEEMLALVKLTGMEGRAIGTLSGGQQQRVALARALVNRPQVLLLDEPLSALDLKLRQQMQVELKALQRRLGHSFVFVTHDQEEALTLSDRIAVMRDGRIERVGSPSEIYESPGTEFVARFIGSINVWDGKLRGEEEVLLAGGSGAGEGGSLRVGFWRQRPRAPQGLADGDDVKVMIRPEKIRMLGQSEPGVFRAEGGERVGSGERAESGENRVPGIIREILFQGAVTQFVVETRLPEGALIQVTQANSAPRAQDEFQAGDRVLLSWWAEDCLVLRGDG